MIKKNKGKFIVIDGIDGSGKATQVALLSTRLKKDGYKIKNVDFPEYYKNFFGKFIGHCLSEQYYNFVNVHPKIASVLYACDRWESSKDIRRYLDSGYIVIANRYVSANQIHQGGKIKNPKKREAFIKWLDEVEYGVFKIPKPDVVFYLSLPLSIVNNLLSKRDSSKMKRAYLKKHKDVHESDEQFLTNSRNSALWLAKTQKYYKKIDCAFGNSIRTREDIHEEIYKKVKNLIKK